jgi:hypothetical protein
MLLGNGRMGVMVWGGKNVLKITLGRSDWWDHRGGKEWTDAMNWHDIRRALEARDEPAIRALFAEPNDGGVARPSLIPVGRFEVHLPANVQLIRGQLDHRKAVVTIDVRVGDSSDTLSLELCMDKTLLRLGLGDSLKAFSVRALPAWETAGQALSRRGIDRPTMIASDNLVGFTQPLPADPGLTALARRDDQTVWIATSIDGQTPARSLVQQATDPDLEASHAWWADYWRRSPTIDAPNPLVQFLFDYGLYKFAGLTCPLGVPAGLQGPWIEDYTTPPWSGDYHFNINVQMCYSPAYLSGNLTHLKPLFDLIQDWMPALHEHARKFIGIDDGIMLPHAVDDRCKIIGSFWTGTIDHGCTAWVGKMMYDHWSFGGADDAWAKHVVLPFLRGAMRVYEQMLERHGERLVLPVSVSPEYRGAEMDAWGRNASFQLACIHMLCEKLIELSSRFGEPTRPIWQELLDTLPVACVEDGKISLWEGTGLEESHRHHSHLAGITPFDVIDPADPKWKAIFDKSIQHWIHKGMGQWSGWCMPWAVQLHTRCGNAGMAELLIESWERVFTNVGHGTLHDCEIAGFTLMGADSLGNPHRNEIMQMDAGMGMVNAIGDMMCYAQRGVHQFFKGCPNRWETVRFDRIHCSGGFVVSGVRQRDEITLDIRATRDGVFAYADPMNGQVCRLDFKAGETRQIRNRLQESV